MRFHGYTIPESHEVLVVRWIADTVTMDRPETLECPELACPLAILGSSALRPILDCAFKSLSLQPYRPFKEMLRSSCSLLQKLDADFGNPLVYPDTSKVVLLRLPSTTLRRYLRPVSRLLWKQEHYALRSAEVAAPFPKDNAFYIHSSGKTDWVAD